MGRLLKILGIGFGLAVTLGNTIGAGILRAPGDIALHLPVVWAYLGIWVVGALYALLGANALSELGVAVPRSGGQYVFVRHALGEYPGFIVGWSDWLSNCGSMAAVAIVIGEYSAALMKSSVSPLMIALSVILFFAIIQWRGVTWGSRAQEITTVMKALAFLILIAACFLAGGTHASEPAPLRNIAWLAGIVLALQQVIFTYDGWTGVIYFSEEVRVPERDIPRSMIGSVLLVAAIYLLVNIGFLYVTPLSSLAGQPLAAGVVAAHIFGAAGDTVLRVLMIVSMLSTINAFQLMGSRTLYALGSDRLFASAAAGVNEGGTPAFALWAGTTVGALFLLTKTFDAAIALLSFFFVANYTLSFVSLFVLRAREPEISAKHRAWGHPWTTGLALAGSVAFLIAAVASDTRSSLISIGILAVSYPVFRFMRRKIEQ